MFELFDDQKRAVKETINHLRSGKTVLLYSPPGSGKTVMCSDIVKQMNLRTMIVVNRQTLLSQTYEKCKHHGLDVSILHNTITKTVDGELMNDDINSQVLVTLIETFENSELDFEPGFIVFDECHKSTSEGYQKLREKYPNALILGLTATPGRQRNKDGEALGEWYDIMVIGNTVSTLISDGRLSKPIYKIFDETDHVVNTWLNLTANDPNKRTIIFAKNASHMIALKKAFNESGIYAEYISSGSELDDVKDEIQVQTPNQRNRIFRRFRDGDLNVLISFGVLCEGFDEPLAKYCFLLRKVSHVSLYHQIIGRVLRYHKTKDAGVICDFHGNVDEFGPIEDYRWEMDGTGNKGSVIARDGSVIHFGYYNRKPAVYVVCSKCHHTYDIEKYEVCNCCSKRNSVKISANFKQMIGFFYQKIDQEAWKRFCAGKFIKAGDEFWTFFEIIERALKNNKTEMFNEMYCEIFRNGKFTREFSWMNVLLENKRKLNMNSKLEFSL